MRVSHHCLFLGAVLASGAQADWQLSDLARPIQDSAVVDSVYGITGYANQASTIGIRVVRGATSRANHIRFQADTVASDSGVGYSAVLGMVNYLRPDKGAYDVRGINAIEFDVRLGERPADGLTIGLSSDLYPDAAQSFGAFYGYKLTDAELPAPGEWKTVRINIADLASPDWYNKGENYPELDSVLAYLRALDFNPNFIYQNNGTSYGARCFRCVDPTQSHLTMDIRNVRLVGVGRLIARDSWACQGANSLLVEDFRDGGRNNNLGGWWSSVSDWTLLEKPKFDAAQGRSRADLAIYPGRFGSVNLDARLARLGSGPWPTPSAAGWAALTTTIDPRKVDLSGLTGIEFKLQADLGNGVKGVTFKAISPKTGYYEAYHATIPKSALKGSARTVCVGVDDLRAWAMPSHGRLATYSNDSLDGIVWEVKLDDPNAAAETAKLRVSDIRLWGAKAPGGRVTPPANGRFVGGLSKR